MASLNHSGISVGTEICKLLVDLSLKTDPSVSITARTLPEKNCSTRILQKKWIYFSGTVKDPEDGDLWEWVILKINEQTSNYLCRMSEDLNISTGTKAEQYESLIPQIKGLLEGESDVIANLANITGALKEQFNWLWTGFYLVKPGFTKTSDKELVLGPFQGPIACTRIRKGKGVCGKSWEKAKTIIVPDVQKFPGHIACSSRSRSEIVVPVIRNNEVIAVLDADSEELNHFDEADRIYLEKIMQLIEF